MDELLASSREEAKKSSEGDQARECPNVLPSLIELDYELRGEGGIVSDAVFSPDGRRLLVASGSEDVRLYAAETGELLLILANGHEDWVRTAGFSPDGMLVVSAAYDGTARVWSAVTGECLQSVTAHSEAVVSVDVFAV